MGAISFKRSSLENYNKYNSLLVGNEFTPPPVDSSYDLLETTTLASSASSVTFSGLGSYTDYKHLQVRYLSRTNDIYDTFGIYLNSTNAVRGHELRGTGSSVTSSARTNSRITENAKNSDPANAFAAGIIDILDFSDTSKNTTIRAISGDGIDKVELGSALYNFTAAITEIKFDIDVGSGSFVTGSRFSLFGVKG